MSKRKLKADELHKKGYNCAQAVACAYCDILEVDEQLIFKLMEGHGLGMGNMMGTCGAITGAVAVAGLKNSTGNLETPDSKGSTYKFSKEIMKQFRWKNNSTLCHELKGIVTGNVLRSCSGCIEDACDILDSLVFEKK